MTNTTLILLTIIALLTLINLIVSWVKKPQIDLTPQLRTLEDTLIRLETTLNRNDDNINKQLTTNRIESNNVAKANREELNQSLTQFGEQFRKNVKELNELLTDSHQAMRTQQTEAYTQTTTTNKQNREMLQENLAQFEKRFSENIQMLNRLIKEKFEEFANQQSTLNHRTTEQVKELKTTVETQLKSIQSDNNKQLDEMRNTVDEKLQKTLNDRLSQSFETVGKQLQAVQEGLGEMKNIATDVGGLKKVLSNVKMRGGIGEVQLAMLLEQILAPDQYETNVKTKTGSSDLVEFAIKLPGKETQQGHIWLPIDAKFPKDMYEQLQQAYEVGEPDEVAVAQKNMENTIKKMAKDISDKYIDPPHTTDFGIMFLPFEAIYAEVVRKASLLEELQRNYKIIVTGPTTLAAILNSLQMGFKTLAIQKRSSEVWQVLGAVKKEFENFGGMMKKAQNNIQTGLNQLDNVMGVRTRAIQRRLRGVETLSIEETKKILPEITDTSYSEEEDEE